jgi:hypothetical protein
VSLYSCAATLAGCPVESSSGNWAMPGRPSGVIVRSLDRSNSASCTMCSCPFAAQLLQFSLP